MFTTGDIGYFDDDGYLWLSDRKIDMIISGGVNIYPGRDRDASWPSTRPWPTSAVIGVPDDEFGEQVKAVVQVVDGVEPSDALADELMALCRRQAGRLQAPHARSTGRDALPRSEAGKLLKRELRAPYWEGTGRSI